MPFGLTPQVLGVIFLVVVLGGGTVLSLLMSRRKTLRVVSTRQQAGQFAPPGYPGVPQQTQPYGDLVGQWNFKPSARWIGVWIGVIVGFGAISFPISIVTLPAEVLGKGGVGEALSAAIASGAAGLLLAGYSIWRPSRAVQHCTVDQRLAITVARGGRQIPLDLNHYRYARMHISVAYARGALRQVAFPSMLVFSRDTRIGVGTLLSSMLFPRVDDSRIVLFYNKWSTADGAFIPYPVLDEFFRDACRRAGHEPQPLHMPAVIGRYPPWEVRP